MNHYFHVGIIVPDLDVAMAEFGGPGGLSWCERMTFVLGEREACAIYSRGGPPHVELIDGSPGSHWGEFAGAPRMHLGYWSEDLEGDTRRAIQAGATMVFDLREFGVGSTLLAMGSSELGLEYADSAQRGSFEQMFGAISAR